MGFRVEPSAEGARFRVRVVPRARKDEVAGLLGDALKVRLAAPPVEGAANRALVKFLAQRLGVRASQVHILAGHTSREKVVAVEGLPPKEVEARLLGRPFPL